MEKVNYHLSTVNQNNVTNPQMAENVHYQFSVEKDSGATVADDELRKVLKELEELPFQDENQKSTFFKDVQRLRGRHVIQCFKLGVRPLKLCTSKNSNFTEEVMKIFAICVCFCYTPEVAKRIEFDYFTMALQFCFSEHTSQCLSTEVLHKLLQLGQILNEGKFASKLLVSELLEVLKTRRDKSHFVEIVDETIRFASKDASVPCIKELVVDLLGDIAVPACLLSWIILLKFEHVSNGFACALAKKDDPQYMSFAYPIPLHHNSLVGFFGIILEEMKRSGSEVILPSEEERLNIFFSHRHAHRFISHSPLAKTSLKLLANRSIGNEVLKKILDQFFFEGKRSLTGKQPWSNLYEPVAFELVFRALSLFPDGILVSKLLNVWRGIVPEDRDYEALLHLIIGLFLQGSGSESYSLAENAETTLECLYCLPQSLLPLVKLWCPFLASCVKIFPTTFQSHQELLVFFIESAARRGKVPRDKLPVYCNLEQRPIINFLQQIAQQSCTENMKEELILLLTSCINKASPWYNCWEFSIDMIKQVSLCQQMRLSVKKTVIHTFTRLAKLFREQGRNLFRKIVEGLVSDQNLKLQDEIFSEIFHFIKRCSEMNTIPSRIQELLLLVSRCSISGDRRVKVLQRSKKTGDGLLCSVKILELVKHRLHVLEEANEYFDQLFFAFFDIFKEDEHMCQQLYNQLLSVASSPQLQDLWSSLVPRLISLDLFDEEIDSRWCWPVLRQAIEVSSPIDMLALYTQLREGSERVVEQLRVSREKLPLSSTRSPNDPKVRECVEQETFVSSLGIVVGSNVLSCQEKLFLVRTVCDIFVQNKNSLTETTMVNALHNLIPFSLLQNNDMSSNKEIMRLELNQIEGILRDPHLMTQLSRLSTGLNKSSKSLCYVFSSKTSDYFSTGTLMDIYRFIGSQEHLNEPYFNNVIMEILEIAVQESGSVGNIIELLEEVASIVRDVPSELTLFIMGNFSNLLKNKVNKEDRKSFFNEVALRWRCSVSSECLSYLEVPRLLWKVDCNTNTRGRRHELVDRIQDILQKTKNVEISSAEDNEDVIKRRIACCDLEWLVLNSSLSTDEAALAYALSRSLTLKQPLRCYTFSDVRIEEGCFTFIPAQEKRLQTPEKSRDEERNQGNDYPAIDPQLSLLTPALMAQKMIYQIKRVLKQGEDLSEVAFSLWDHAFGHRLACCEAECAASLTFYDDYLNVLLSILSESSSTEMMLHWAKLDSHFTCQCVEVVLKACKSSSDFEKEAKLNFQALVSNTLMQLKSPTADGFPSVRPFPCFLHLKPGLYYLGRILGSGLSIKVTTQILKIFQTNVLAAGTVADIVSSWSSQDQVMKVVRRVHSFCKKEEDFPLNPFQSQLVWQLLNAFGRFCKDSSENLMAKFDELLLLRDLEDKYGINRLPKWREMMIAGGFSSQVIDCWCVAFLTTPLKELSSRDIDAIVDLNSNLLEIVPALSEKIKSCVFPEDGFKVTITQGEGIKEPSTKERIRLAKLLCELINMLKLGKPEENRTDAVIKEKVVDACYKLCEAYENPEKKRNGKDLYRIHRKMLKALLTVVFGRQCESDPDVNSCGEASQTDDSENLPRILRKNEVFEPLLVLLRRWLSRSAIKPTLVSHTQEVVQLLFLSNPATVGPELHSLIQAHILSVEENQNIVAQLEALGYNQSTLETRNLWSSLTVERSGYISKRESPDSRRFVKKMTQNLRFLLNQWKHILFMLGTGSIKVGETDVPTENLFGLESSLEDMKKQSSAVKETVNQLELGSLERTVKQLMREEQRLIERLDKICEVRLLPFSSQ